MERKERCLRKARKKCIAVVKAGEDQRSSEFGGSISRKIFADRRDSAEVIVTRLGGGSDEVLHREGVVKDNAKIFCCGREGNRNVIE